MINEVIEAFTRLDEDPDIGVGVMYGLNGNFSSGGDMDMMLGLNYQTGHIWNNKMRRLCMALRNSGKPTIAMVRGWCIGGGNEWQLYCDLCIASENATFGQSGARVGALPVVGATQYLPLLMGDRRAREMLFMAKRYPAQEAKEVGRSTKSCRTMNWRRRPRSGAPPSTPTPGHAALHEDEPELPRRPALPLLDARQRTAERRVEQRTIRRGNERVQGEKTSRLQPLPEVGETTHHTGRRTCRGLLKQS